ncbi:MAG TPA: hypothetical protein VN408_14040 [Actinoplanes sp.]|nr:hypothetical protein [Actinoplanes sp.]
MTDSPQPPAGSSQQPADSPQPADQSGPAPRKPLNSSWIFPIGGGLIGAYFLINGALGVRETQGNVVFALLMAGIVVIVGVLGTLLFRSYRAERKR